MIYDKSCPIKRSHLLYIMLFLNPPLYQIHPAQYPSPPSLASLSNTLGGNLYLIKPAKTMRSFAFCARSAANCCLLGSSYVPLSNTSRYLEQHPMDHRSTFPILRAISGANCEKLLAWARISARLPLESSGRICKLPMTCGTNVNISDFAQENKAENLRLVLACIAALQW